ncbi:MAG: hypothetical protein HXY30_20010 [Pseudorhodoplanes sp.]|nr:hypothetical protein [Pseudorhodoplanes sp.]
MRLLHILMIGLLVGAAVWVYEIKLDSALQAERLAKLRGELRRERDAVAMLRAEWSRLDTPARIQGLAQRHLGLRPLEAVKIDNLDKLPERPAAPRPDADPIGGMIDAIGDPAPIGSVGSAGIRP